MKITSIYIENFGCLHAYRLEPEAGLSVICEDNGFGKTTLAAFISAMLYDLPVTRKTDPCENERKKYQPWQGGAFGGTMTFTVGARHYRAERFFAASGSRRGDTFTLYDLDLGTVSDDYGPDLGMALFGVDAEGFARSAFLPQRALSVGISNESITAGLNNALSADHDTGGYDTAVALLEKQRQFYKKTGNRGRIAELEGSLAALSEKEAECRRAAAERDALDAECTALSAQLSQMTDARASLDRQSEALAGARATAARMEHAGMLLSARDRLGAAAAEKRRFLGTERTPAELQSLLGAAQADISREELLTARLEEDRAGLAASLARMQTLRHAGQYPIGDDLHVIRSASDTLRYALQSLQQSGSAVPDAGEAPSELLTRETLDRHVRQAAAFAAETEALAQPCVAAAARQRMYAEAGFSPDSPLPEDAVTALYADTLHILHEAQNGCGAAADACRRDREALDALLQRVGKEGLPNETELVANRTKYDSLVIKKLEIDALEEKQHAAATAQKLLRDRRKRHIGTGTLLLLLGAALAGLSFVPLVADLRLLLVGTAPVLLGLGLLLWGWLGRGDADTRVLDDDIFKRLCEKKSEYETDKSAVYEFLDRCAGESVTDTDAAERIFAEAGAVVRQHATLVSAVADGEQAEARYQAEIAGHREILAGLRQAHGLPETEDEDVFRDYRTAVRRCMQADADAKREVEERRRCQTRRDALRMTLDAYLSRLEETDAAAFYTYVPTDTGEGDGIPDYLARLGAWQSAAEMLRQQIAAANDALRRTTDAARELRELLAPFTADRLTSDTADTDTDTDETPAATAERAQALLSAAAERDAVLLALETSSKQTEERIRETENEVRSVRERIRAFLSQFFEEPYPAPREALAVIAETRGALEDDMTALRQQQNALLSFLSENQFTEESVRTFLSEHADGGQPATERASLQEKRLALEGEISALRDRLSAKRHAAERASATAAEIVSVQEAMTAVMGELDAAKRRCDIILRTRSLLDEARSAMSVRYLGAMTQSFRQYYAILCGITEAQAEALVLDEDLVPRMEVGGVLREYGYFSRGTGDLIGLCIRFALIDALYDPEASGGNERPPLILDDPFVNLDASRLEAAKKLLGRAAERYQILYFICHGSRM